MRINFYNNKYAKDIVAKSKYYKVAGLDWQDIAQELDIALWKNLLKFEGRNSAKERTFAIHLMKNKILDLAKTAARQKRFIDSNHFVFSQLETTDEGQFLLDSGQKL